MIDSDTKEVIWTWALHNMGPWLLTAMDASSYEKEFYSFNEISSDSYLFKISGGSIEIVEKPVNISENNHSIEVRLDCYLKFFRSVVNRWLPSEEMLICVCVGDGAVHHPYLPTFCFQKLDGWTQILIPDIDFLTNNFYTDTYTDDVLYYDKVIEAIFVGATTGGINTVESVRARSLPRLSAAEYFSSRFDVKFFLPNIVQCENSEAAEELKKISYCAGNYIPWKEQLKSRFLISMDGNGATCSRVYLALLSNSALLKYESPYRLYYFQFLKPMQHYLPISRHSDVEAYLERERQGSATGAAVAASGREFALRFLNREAVEFYMAALLKIYSKLLIKDGPLDGGVIKDNIFDELNESCSS